MNASPDSIGSPDEGAALAAPPGGLLVLAPTENSSTLADLPIGAHLILRCRKDWRDATVTAATLESITLSVGSPSGRTYRVRRPPATPLSFDSTIPVLGEGCWRAALVQYDQRW